MLQRRAAGADVEQVPPIVHDVLRSPGQPLDAATRAFMEPRFGRDFSGVRVHTDTRAAENARARKAAQAPTNEFEDCPPDWQVEAEAALVVARQWVAMVVSGLTNLPSPLTPDVAKLLMTHFHTTNSKDIAEIARHFMQVNAALNSSIDFECETSCDKDVEAYVYSIWTDLHLCPIWHGKAVEDQAATIIHEIAHDAANRDDEAYIWEASYKSLSVDDAIDNADSYAYFAKHWNGK